MIDLEEEGYKTPPHTIIPTRKTPNIDPFQQEIYDYVESLEQRAQQRQISLNIKRMKLVKLP